jgi:hypothetical protein
VFIVFALSSESGEKITLAVSILLALTLFFLMLLDMMPPTSLVVPLLGKYLVFIISMVSMSISVTIFILNIHHRTPEIYHKMPDGVRFFFLKLLPKLFLLNNLKDEENNMKIFKSKQLVNITNDHMETIEKIENEQIKMENINNNNNNNKVTFKETSNLYKNQAKPLLSYYYSPQLNSHRRFNGNYRGDRVVSQVLKKNNDYQLEQQHQLLQRRSSRQRQFDYNNEIIWRKAQKKRANKYTSMLVKQNIEYLVEIANFMKRDTTTNKVYLHFIFKFYLYFLIMNSNLSRL